jgi:hypothetical protein
VKGVGYYPIQAKGKREEKKKHKKKRTATLR